MAKSPAPPPPRGPEATVVQLRQALEERYLAYALSTIMGRALPDARDGLKPVHRRILYGMQVLRLDPQTGFKKCAKIVGDVMGDFHPHGDQAIYDALVRLAQDFSSRYPLVDGQGNFGNIDGDPPAAYRYTEARMTDVAKLLLEGIEDDTVDLRDNYSGEKQEPIVLPAAFPNLLANGAQGIAVGMATSIPPHNVAELCDAALHLIAHPEAESGQLLGMVRGPDFPTGGVIVDEPAVIAENYRTGRGSFRLRARWAIEDTGRGTWAVVVTEIPYGVQKSRLIERLAEVVTEKKSPLIADVRDESTEDVRVVIEPRSRTVDPRVLMEHLFRLTELEARIPLNLNVLVDGVVPRVVSLAEALRQWLDHRRVVLVRRSRHRLGEIERRLEVLAGMLIVFLNLDEVIRIIREEDEPKLSLKATFGLSDLQADYVLDTRLRSLRRLEEMNLRKEHDGLTKEKEGLQALIASDGAQWKAVAAQIREVKRKYGPATALGKRRTSFEGAPEFDASLPAQAMIEREPVTVVISEKGWIRTLKGHVAETGTLTFKSDDRLSIAFFTETTGRIIVLATDGRVFSVDVSKLPSGRGYGEPLRLMADLGEGEEVASVLPYEDGGRVLVASTDGRGFVVPMSELVVGTRKGKSLVSLNPPAKAKLMVPARGDHVAVVSADRHFLVFPIVMVPEMARGKGVRLQRTPRGISDLRVFTMAEGLKWCDTSGRERIFSSKDLQTWVGKRSERGHLPPKGFPKTNRFED